MGHCYFVSKSFKVCYLSSEDSALHRVVKRRSVQRLSFLNLIPQLLSQILRVTLPSPEFLIGYAMSV